MTTGCLQFLDADATALAVMTAAVDVVEAAGMHVDRGDDPDAHARRAVQWNRYARGPVNALHRACAADIVRGSLRLLDQAEVRPLTAPRQVVLVAGPRRSGVTSLAAALRERMPEQAIVEAGDASAGDRPAMVVVVVSAVAPMTESDCAYVDVVAAEVDVVVGVVAKIDAHRGWRAVLTADRAALCAHSPRYRSIPWVGVAASPDVGEPNVDELVAALRDGLRDAGLAQRNQLRVNEFP